MTDVCLEYKHPNISLRSVLQYLLPHTACERCHLFLPWKDSNLNKRMIATRYVLRHSYTLSLHSVSHPHEKALSCIEGKVMDD